jgi:hypothetical protein
VHVPFSQWISDPRLSLQHVEHSPNHGSAPGRALDFDKTTSLTETFSDKLILRRHQHNLTSERVIGSAKEAAALIESADNRYCGNESYWKPGKR